MAKKQIKSIDEILSNAKQVEFLTAAQNNNVPAVFIIFEDFNTGWALYSEALRVNKEQEQFFRFKKEEEQLRIDIMLKEKGYAHAKFLVDYDEGEFDEFIQNTTTTTSYVVLFGQYGEDGTKRIGAGHKGETEFLVFHQYLVLP
jgi:hypothetical protein